MDVVALVCVAGVSGTFLARRLTAAMPDVTFTVTTLHSLPQAIARVDAVLVAPQCAASLEQLRLIAAPRPIAVLPKHAVGPDGTPAAVAFVRDMLKTDPEPQPRSEHV